MLTFNWIHLSDLHWGATGQDQLWPNLLDTFLSDVKTVYSAVGPVHAILFTGDLTYSGEESQFDSLDERLFNPLITTLRDLGSDPLLLAIPGNHDLVRPGGKNLPPEVRLLLMRDGIHAVSDEFWANPVSPYRKSVETVFQHYSNWWNKWVGKNSGAQFRQGILPGDFSTKIEVADAAEGISHKIGVVGLNSAFLQLNGEDFAGRLSIGMQQLNEVCAGNAPLYLRECSASLLLTHHGVDWLDKRCRSEVYPEINPAGRFTVHLYGHDHDLRTNQSASEGGKALRYWQGASIFGMEKYGNPPEHHRRHGYSFGQISFERNCNSLRYWPRTAAFSGNGWRFSRDTRHELQEEDGGTRPEAFDVAKAVPKRSRLKLLFDGKAAAEHLIAGIASQQPPTTGGSQELGAYKRAICEAHSHIRFVEIPFLKDISDVMLDRLYVEPKFCVQEIRADTSQNTWPTRITPCEALSKDEHLVLLGDPGSGKSTLISCLSWLLASDGEEHPWKAALTGRVPLTMILRELQLRADLTWESLLQSFLSHRIGKLLGSQEKVEQILKSGEAVVMLDGLDEIGNTTIRTRLRDAVHAGMSLYPKVKWVLTSRSVGYEQVPFHYKLDVAGEGGNTAVLEEAGDTKNHKIPMAELLYLSPFDDEQISAFASNWYSHHELAADVAGTSAADFLEAIRRNDGTQRLARIPYLLTLMALVHHKNCRLPHGRTELYERIATAYLESIDLRRKLDHLPYSLTQKQRWLANVAYRMQLRRVKKGNDAHQGDILATKSEVQRWLRAVMEQTGNGSAAKESDELLEYFARRTGLLLPRGEGKFSFMHLSLQEYFAACFLEERLTASRFAKPEKNPEPSNEEVHAWAGTEAWRETYVLLFELLSEKGRSETEALLDHLFDGRLDNLDPDGSTAAGLLAELTGNPFIALSAATRAKMKGKCWRWALGQRRGWHYRGGNRVVRTLLVDAEGDLTAAWKHAGITAADLDRATGLDLGRCTSLVDVRPIERLRSLRYLSLELCANVRDLTPLGRLRNLEFLNLDGCGSVLGAESIEGLSKLKTLIMSTPIDLTAMQNMRALRQLHLHYRNEETDISALAGLSKLDHLCVYSRKVKVHAKLKRNPEGIRSQGVARFLKEHTKEVVSARSNVRTRRAARAG